MVARRVAVATATVAANVARGKPPGAHGVASRVPDVARDLVRRTTVARAVALRFIGVVFQVTVRPRFGRMVARLVAEAAAVRVERAGCGPDVRGSALRRHYVARHFTRRCVFAAPCVCVGVVAGAGGRRLL